MIKAVIFSDDHDLLGPMFERMFQKMGHSGTHVGTTEELIHQTQDKAADILVLEIFLGLKSEDWSTISETFSKQSNPIPIIITTWVWNKDIEAHCVPLRIEKVLIYPCDIPNGVISVLTDLFPNESFNANWNNTEN
jgi:DNA-binding NtrC family response regulator